MSFRWVNEFHTIVCFFSFRASEIIPAAHSAADRFPHLVHTFNNHASGRLRNESGVLVIQELYSGYASPKKEQLPETSTARVPSWGEGSDNCSIAGAFLPGLFGPLRHTGAHLK